MARPLFEQYKDALRRGHLALLGDELEAALAAYREAASLVADRPLPHASIGAVLERLGRTEEAVVAYDLALALAPDDRVVASARDALVATLAAAPRGPTPPVAADASVAPEPATVPRVDGALEAAPAEPAAPAAPALESLAGPTDVGGSRPDDDEAAIEAMRAALGRFDGPAAAGARADEVEPGIPDPTPPAQPAAAPGSWPAIDLPSLPPPPREGPPPDPMALQSEADALLEAGDEQGAGDRLILAARVHRDAGRLDAAIDACLQLLAIAPGDPRVHLAIANLQLDLGWRPVATEKIELLLRLTSLTGDAQAEADVHLLAADRLRDESPVRLDARRRGLPTP